MTGVLKTLLEITVYSAVLFAAVLTLKLIFRRQLSAPMHYLLWLLVVARLLMPVTIDSDLRLFVVPQEPAAVQPAAAPGEQAELDIKENTGVTEYAQQPAVTINPQTAYSGGETGAAAPAAAAPKRADWAAFALIVWIFGMCLYFGVLAWLHVRFLRIVRRGAVATPGWAAKLAEECAKELGIRRRVRVRVQSGLSSPALTLSLRPKLLLPQSMLDGMSKTQIMLGIRHELTHYKHRDHLMSLLLLVLRGVYWFNPVVWIAHRMMLADMEAACDARATLGLEQRQRNLYVNTIIDLGCDAYAHYALGMGAGRGRKEMERRIRGLFMTRKSGHIARLAAVLLVPLLLLACFTTACQPTPAEPIIKDKGQDLSSYVEATPEAADETAEVQMGDADALYEKLGAPKHWTMETQEMDGRLNIVADVDVELPTVDKLPAATAVLREFSQEEINKIVETVLGSGLQFTEAVDFTKESLQAEILEIKQNLAEKEALKAAGEWPAKGSWCNEESVKEYESRLADAPSESELKAKDLSIETIEQYGFTYKGFRVKTVMDGQPYIINAGDIVLSEAVHSIRIATGDTRGAYFIGTYLDEPYGISLTKEAAAEQAQAIAAQLTDELKLCYVVPTATGKAETKRNWGWACVFMREINGCPTAYESTDVGSDMETTVSEPVPYEKMVIVMDDMGMVSFEWETPMTLESIDNPDVTLLPFDEISQRAAAQIGQRWAYDAIEAKSNEGKDMSDPGCTAIITKVELGLMRVAKADSDDYYYIPVWNFFTDFEHTDDYWERTGTEPYSWDDHDYVDEEGNSTIMCDSYPQAWGAVTINALDGSVIDRDKGY